MIRDETSRVRGFIFSDTSSGSVFMYLFLAFACVFYSVWHLFVDRHVGTC